MARSRHNFRIDLRGKELGSILIVDTDVPLVGQKLKLWPAARHSVSAVMAASVAMVTETSSLPSPPPTPGAGKPTALRQVSVFMPAKRPTRTGFLATAQGTEEAIVNAQVAAEVHD